MYFVVTSSMFHHCIPQSPPWHLTTAFLKDHLRIALPYFYVFTRWVLLHTAIRNYGGWSFGHLDDCGQEIATS